MVKAIVTAGIVFITLGIVASVSNSLVVLVVPEAGVIALAFIVGFLLLVVGGLIRLWSGRMLRSMMLIGLITALVSGVWLMVLDASPAMEQARMDRILDSLEDQYGFYLRP